MIPAFAPGQGPVAVHRWFARGEDWAMHPWFAPRVGEVLRALDERIKARQAGPFQLDAAGGVLVGELLEDAECLDPRAAERRPCVVRLAFAAGLLSYREQEGVLAALRGMALPASPGIDQGLVVAVPQVAPAARAAAGRQAEPAKPGYGPFALLVLLAALAAAVAAWLLARTPARERSTDFPPKRAEAPRGDLKALLARYAKIDHPFIAFLKQHPAALERARRGAEPDYERWREARELAFRDEGHLLPRRLRERVALWRELPPALAEAAQRMRRIRRRWTGGEEMPALADEFDAFFDAATRPGQLPPREEFDHPANAFLWRLPRDPVAAGRAFDSEKDLGDALGRLAQRLTGAQPSPSAGLLDLLGTIERSMDYRAWRDQQRREGKAFADEGQEPGPAIEAGLRRFGGKGP